MVSVSVSLRGTSKEGHLWFAVVNQGPNAEGTRWSISWSRCLLSISQVTDLHCSFISSTIRSISEHSYQYSTSVEETPPCWGSLCLVGRLHAPLCSLSSADTGDPLSAVSLLICSTDLPVYLLRSRKYPRSIKHDEAQTCARVHVKVEKNNKTMKG